MHTAATNRNRRAFARIFSLVLVVLACGICACSLPFFQTEAVPAALPVSIPVAAEGLDAEGTRIPARIEALDIEGQEPERVYLEHDGSGIELVPGSYAITVLGSPISKDGTVFERPSETITCEVSAPEAAGEASRALVEADGTLTLVPLEPATLTDAQIEEARTWAERDPERKDVALELAELATARRDAELERIAQEQKAAEEAKRAAEEEEARKKAEDEERALLERTWYFGNYSFVIPESWAEKVSMDSQGSLRPFNDASLPVVTFADLANNYYADPNIPGDYENLANGNLLKLMPGDDGHVAAIVSDSQDNKAFFYTNIASDSIDYMLSEDQRNLLREYQVLASGLSEDSDPQALARATLRALAETIVFE